MKRGLIGCAIAIVAVTSIVNAQDPQCGYPQVCDSVCNSCAESFDGLYLGGNLGVFSHVARRNDLDGLLTDNSGWTNLDTSITGGVQAGYDWRCGNRVFGLVADWNLADAGSILEDNPNGAGSGNVLSDIEWFSTFRVRAGLAVNDALVYVSAGPALGRFENLWSDPPATFQFSDTRLGWAGTVGTEFQLSNKLSVGAELFYLHFEDYIRSGTDAQATTFAFGHNDSGWGARIMVNYRFR